MRADIVALGVQKEIAFLALLAGVVICVPAGGAFVVAGLDSESEFNCCFPQSIIDTDALNLVRPDIVLGTEAVECSVGVVLDEIRQTWRLRVFLSEVD